jgi:dihydroflavonol-4-reductase
VPLARVVEWRARRKRSRSRPALSLDSAKFVSWYFFFSAVKARRELGFDPRPLRDSLRDTHAFWHRSGQLATRTRAA